MTIKDGITIRPRGQSYLVGFEEPSHISKTDSLKDAHTLKAFYQHIRDRANGLFSIKEIGERNGTVTPVTIIQGGKEITLNIDVFELQEELDLSRLSHLTFSSPSTFATNTTEALQAGNFRDGFTLAATSYFELKQKKVSEVPRQWSFFSPQSRLVVDEDKVVLTRRGLSRFERIFHRLFNTNTYREYMRQNTATIEAYQNFLQREVGAAKVNLIERTFGISLDEMKNEGHPLLPSHIHYFNTGMNHIEMRDVEAFKEKIENVFKDYHEEERVIDFFTEEEHNFTMREMRGMLTFFETPETTTMKQLHEHFEQAFFNRCVDAVMTPRADWEGAYTGRKFSAPIKGSYNKEVDDYETLRYEIDMQEMAQVHHEILDAASSDETLSLRIFNEYLVKIAAKKHPMISTADGSEWRVGGIIPSPFRDVHGEIVWYRVDQAVDSAHGKLWYVFKPANEDTSGDFPVFRAMRDTCRQNYALRAGPTLSRDLAEHAGYKYSNTTELEDREFFDQFTLPVWMSYLFAATKENNTDERLQLLKTATEELMQEVAWRFTNLRLTPAEKGRYTEKLEAFLTKKSALLAAPSEEAIEDFIDQIKAFASRKDRILFEKLLDGKHPPPVVSGGSSLGGFDAQFDVVKHTAYRHRLPITLMLVYSHSTLKIHEDDDKALTEFMLKHKDVMHAMGGTLAFDHITEDGDIVSMFGSDRTFLGKGLKDQGGFPFEFRVFSPLKETSDSPEILQLGTHIRRVEGLKKGTDIEWADYSVEQYEEISRQKRVARATLDAWHWGGVKLGLFGTSDSVWRLSRYFNRGTPHISWEDRNKKLVVKYEERHRFASIHPNHLQTERRSARESSAEHLLDSLDISSPLL
ncbi:hypothetical protein [Simkania sp.]|uniref:hypothetical protein n=1 Tax=Simkania sp. TaxID=34094 RepID=UPI003B52E2DE